LNAPPKDISADVSAIERLLRVNRRIGRARIRRYKGAYWELDFRSLGGKRLRRYRRSPTAAYRLALQITKEIDEHGQVARALTSAQRVETAMCLKLLEPTGATFLEVVRDYVKRHPLGGNARTLDDVRRELVAKKLKGNRRDRYVKDFDYKLRCLVKAIGNQGISALTTDDFEREIARHKWAPGTVHSYVQTWKVLLNYAVKRGYRTDNPCDRLELPERDIAEPQIFSVADVRRMFALTLFRDRDHLLPECQTYLAIGIFAGIRPDEIDRLDWQEVDLTNATITVLGAKAKCRARRIVDMSANLLTWIRPHARKTGTVLRHPVRKLRDVIRRAMGLKEWPHDVLRHSFGSYHYGKHRNEALVKNQMGHCDDGRMFFSHYRVLVHPKVASEFWEIRRPAALLEAPRS
jgi:integrase